MELVLTMLLLVCIGLSVYAIWKFRRPLIRFGLFIWLAPYIFGGLLVVLAVIAFLIFLVACFLGFC